MSDGSERKTPSPACVECRGTGMVNAYDKIARAFSQRLCACWPPSPCVGCGDSGTIPTGDGARVQCPCRRSPEGELPSLDKESDRE